MADDFRMALEDLLRKAELQEPDFLRDGVRVLAQALRRIRDRGRAAGLAVCLETPIEAIGPHLNEVDLVVLMGTALGVKGADLAPEAKGRIASLRLLLSQHGRHEQVKIEADGGLRRHTVPQLRAVGAQLISPGSLVFESHDLRETFGWLRSLPSKLEGYGTP